MLAEVRRSLGLLQVALDVSAEAMLILDGSNRVSWGNQRAADLWTNGLPILLPGKLFSNLVQLVNNDGSKLNYDEPNHPLKDMQQADGSARLHLRLGAGEQSRINPQRLSWRRVNEVPGGFLLITFRDLEPDELALLKQQQFLNQLAHELRTPLAIVRGCLQRIARDTKSQQSQPDQLLIATQETKRIDRLLEQLSLLLQLESKSYPFKLQCRNLSWFVEEWKLQLIPTDRQRVNIIFDGLDSTAVVELDKMAMNRILDQLLENSIRYSAITSRIQISAKACDTKVSLLFMDWGFGVPEQHRLAIFERFTRLEIHRDSNQSDGSGLGLAVVQGLVEAMGGTVCIYPNTSADDKSVCGSVVKLQFLIQQSPTQ